MKIKRAIIFKHRKSIALGLDPYDKLWCTVFRAHELLFAYTPQTNSITLIYRGQKEEALEKAIRRLPQIQEKIIRMYFGLKKRNAGGGSYNPRIYPEIGGIIGITTKRIYYLVKQAMRRLEKELASSDKFIDLETIGEIYRTNIRLTGEAQALNEKLSEAVFLIKEKSTADALRIYSREKIEKFLTPAANLEISIRLKNYFRRLGIYFAGELAGMNKNDLMRKGRFAAKSLKEVEKVLEKEGLELNMELDESILLLMKWSKPENPA